MLDETSTHVRYGIAGGRQELHERGLERILVLVADGGAAPVSGSPNATWLCERKEDFITGLLNRGWCSGDHGAVPVRGLMASGDPLSLAVRGMSGPRASKVRPHQRAPGALGPAYGPGARGHRAWQAHPHRRELFFLENGRW